MKLYYRNIGRMVVCLLFAGVITDTMACLTTFINDKGRRVIIYNKNDKAIIPVSRNEKRRFGNQHKHAHFAIYIQQPKSPFFSRVYVCKQNTCGKKGNILLKLSDIDDQTDATQLFTITKSEPHASMVEELPMFKKKNCHSCPSN
jgi:hypothetical protein